MAPEVSSLPGQGYLEDFVPVYVPRPRPTAPALMFVFSGRLMMMKSSGGRLDLPREDELEAAGEKYLRKKYIGDLCGRPCCFAEAEGSVPACSGMSYRQVRDLSGEGGSAQLFRVAGYAFHLMNWLRRSQYCGTCGAEFIDKADELARICPACGRVEYPRISPATITAVIKDDSILLAHNRSFRAGRYGLIAGFVEPGETLEDCVRREILEETGITVRNISYIGSQPWPFPDSLMAGFTAEYDSGEVRADGSELSDARWFRRGELPEIPGTDSIAGRMIRRFEQRKLPELQKFAAPV